MKLKIKASILLSIILIIASLLIYKNSQNKPHLVKKTNSHRQIKFTKSSLNLPKHAECKQKDWVLVTNDGILLHNEEVLNQLKIEIRNCTYSAVTWLIDDFNYKEGNPEQIANNQKLDSNAELFFIRCISKNSKKYRGAFQRIFKPKINQDIRSQQPINVFMLGADSISRELWLNFLPKSSYFLIENMNSTVLNGYNIVGDGTGANLIPILTSKHQKELPSTLKTDKNSTFVNLAYPFIWKKFSKELNYATLLNEEWPDLGK